MVGIKIAQNNLQQQHRQLVSLFRFCNCTQIMDSSNCHTTEFDFDTENKT